MYIRSKVVKGGTYYQVVEGYRDDAGRVRHRTVVSLGHGGSVTDAAAWVKKSTGATRSRLTQLAPFADSGRTISKKVDQLRRRLDRLTQQAEGLARAKAGLGDTIDGDAAGG